jgi:signal transduction histidine kinase
MSQRADAFGEDDLSWLRITATWIGNLVHRSELTEAYAVKSTEQAKRSAAEELITVLAHDLRNLLGPVVTRLALLQESARERDEAEDVEHCTKALHGLGLVTELMSDLLDVARIEQGLMSLTYQTLDIVALARTVAEALTTPAVPVEVDSYVPELRVMGDRVRLSQAFENIVSNATKHSPRGVPAVMQLRLIKHEVGDAVEILIIDRGAGIHAELLPRVFERFVRAGPRSGLGLGLYLARATITAHGGSIDISSTPGQGTRCEIVLPTTPLTAGS